MSYVGYEWLRQKLAPGAFEIPHPARVRPVTRVLPDDRSLAVPAHVAPQGDDPLDHVIFALKHEGTNLQVLAEALPKLAGESLLKALEQTPNGRYIRIACHLWEGFTGHHLPVTPRINGRYVDVFDPERYLTGEPRRDPRWRVSFNGLGSLRYCLTVRRVSAIQESIASNILGRAQAFVDGLGSVVLDRALAWAYLHETEDSYAIENERPSEDKARAFVHLLHQAHDRRPLSEEYLAELQSSTVTNPLDKAVQFRTEQNWLRGPGRGALGVSYVPPWPELAVELMQELMAFANDAPASVDPLVVAGLVSFGFVFIHPFMDGNGRLSRFLFHQALCNSGRLARGLVLPVSVAMKRHEEDYLAALKSFSRPAREQVQVTWIDEGSYGFEFKGGETMFRYWDATACVEFGFRMAAEALDVELKQETRFLAHYDEIVRRVDEQVDLRGSDLGTLVVVCLDNDGVISHKKRKRFADRVPAGVFDLIESITKDVLAATPEPKGAASERAGSA